MMKEAIKDVGSVVRKIRNNSVRKWTVETLIRAGFNTRKVNIHVGHKVSEAINAHDHQRHNRHMITVHNR